MAEERQSGGEKGGETPDVCDYDVSKATAERVPSVILEKVRARRLCGVVPVMEGVVAGKERGNVVNKLNVYGGLHKEGGGSKKESSV